LLVTVRLKATAREGTVAAAAAAAAAAMIFGVPTQKKSLAAAIREDKEVL
jgi:hypothetical protein